MLVPLNKIKPTSKPVRTVRSDEKMKELIDSIREYGIIVPPKLRPNGKGYDIVYGHRRIDAARLAGLKEIECLVEGIDDEDMVIQGLIENVVREGMNDADKSTALREIKRLTGKPWSEIGPMFGWTGSTHVKALGSITDDEADILLHIEKDIEVGLGHIKHSRIAGNRSLDVLQKTVDEELSKRQTEHVAKAVKFAPNDKAKDRVIEEPYDPGFWHNPAWIEIRAEEHGEHDPIWKSQDAKADLAWMEAPKVVEILNDLKEWKARVEEHEKTIEAGKLSPEAYGFIGRRFKSLARKLYSVHEMLEEFNGEGSKL